MESRAHAVVALAFLALLGIGVVVAGLWMHHGRQPGLIYDVISPYSVAGLQEQAPVRFKGVRVGEVRSIGLDPRNPRMILVRITVSKGTPITRATFAELAPQGVTGLSYLSLSDAGTDFAPVHTSTLHPGQIPMHPSFLEVLSRKGESLVNQSNELASHLSATLNASNRRHLAQTIRQLDTASAQLVQLEAALLPTIKALPAVVAATRSTMQESQIMLKNLNQLTLSAAGPLREVGAAARSIQGLGSSGEKVTETLNYSTLPQLEILTRRLNGATEALEGLSQSLQRSPQSLLYGAKAPPPGPGERGFHGGGGS